MTKRTLYVVGVMAMAVVGCGDGEARGPDSGGPEPRVDLGPEPRVDLGPEPRVDLGPEPRVDLGPDARVDLGPDARVDLGRDGAVIDRDAEPPLGISVVGFWRMEYLLAGAPDADSEHYKLDQSGAVVTGRECAVESACTMGTCTIVGLRCDGGALGGTVDGTRLQLSWEFLRDTTTVRVTLDAELTPDGSTLTGTGTVSTGETFSATGARGDYTEL